MKKKYWAKLKLAILAFFFVLLIGAPLVFRPAQFYPIVAWKMADSLEFTFLQKAKFNQDECVASVDRVVKALQGACARCVLMESRCLPKLDPLQTKILKGKPLDTPVLRVSTGIIAFTGTAANLRLDACQESERQARRLFPDLTLCVPPAKENLNLSLTKVSNNGNGQAAPEFVHVAGIFLFTFLVASLICYVIVRSQNMHGQFSHDKVASGPQKFHATPTPRVGGIAVAAALMTGLYALHLMKFINPSALDGVTLLTLAAIPAFAAGLAEDLTKKVGVLVRLACTLLAGVLASLLVGATIDHVDIPATDFLLQFPIIAIAFTALAVGGLANAINIIDGYNGLAGGYSLVGFFAIAIVAFQVGDPVVLWGSLIMGGATLGLLSWNYPKGKIFLGDGGAYLIGFWLAELAVLLVTRNPVVSPWFPVAIFAYPIFETIFSVYRRRFLHGTNPGHPDALHLHQLIYLRLVRFSVGSRQEEDLTRRNSAVAKYIWVGCISFMLPAILLFRDTPLLVLISLIFCFLYLWLYVRIVNWRAPTWLIVS